MSRRWFIRVIAAALAGTGCRPPGASTAPSAEVARVRAGGLDVVLLSDEGALTHGKDTVTIEFRSASDGRLVDVGTVRGRAVMPMAGMAPMVGSLDVRPAGTPGRYVAASELSMAGEWQLALEWTGPAGSGSARFSPLVQ